MKKRFLAFVLSMCLAVTLIPTAWAANKGYTINGTNVTAASGTAVWNCSTYASQVLRKVWTVGTATMTTYNSKYNLLKGKSAAERELTQTHTKEYIQQTPLGARIRICASSDTTTNNYDNSSLGHTLVLVAKNNTAGTFTVLHAGWGASEARTYTYQEFVNVWANNKGYHYFFYIADYSAAATNKQDEGKVESTPAYTVIFNANGGSVFLPSMNVTNGTIYNSLPNPTRDGYTFTGWYTEKSGGSQIVPTTIVNLKGSQTLYAHWSKNDDDPVTYTITFNANGGSGFLPNMSVTNGTLYNSLPDPIRDGYTFVGWFTEKSGGLQVTPATTVNLKGDQTLYAHWTKNPGEMCTVTFETNGGTVSQKTVQVAKGNTLNFLPTPTRSGYTFVCWSNTNEASGLLIKAGDYIVEQDVTLYAWWTKNSEEMCTVTFEANGGTVSQKTVQVAKGNTLNSLPTPTRSGYTFVCWSNTNGASGLLIEAGKYIVEQDVTLYAWWMEEKTQETGHWGPWSSWTTKSYTMSATRQVETKEIQTVVAHMEYRYGRYVDQTGANNCWCGKYLEGLSYITGKAKLEYSNWSSTRYNPSGSTWTCGQCNGNHIGVDHVDAQGRPIWKEYRLSGNKPYYWEESKIVGAQYETQYRYRDWISD